MSGVGVGLLVVVAVGEEVCGLSVPCRMTLLELRAALFAVCSNHAYVQRRSNSRYAAFVQDITTKNK